MRSLALLLALAGCNAPAVPVVLHVSEEDREQAEEAVALASDLLVPLVLADEGQIHVFVGDFSEEAVGSAPWHTGCRRLVWSVTADPAVLAHELGHALIGAGHSSDPGNLMYSAGDSDPVVTDEQVEAAERSARRLARCMEADHG